jgi:arylsulfatase A-like enzyme
MRGIKMNLKLFLAFIGAAVGCMAATRPNIVLILADDLGWRDVGFAGAELYRTPNIDRMAAAGMIFTQAYSSGPNCAPTRACLMTGLYTPRHGIYTPGGRSKGNPAHMGLLVPALERKDKELEKRARKLVPSNKTGLDFVCIPEILADADYISARLGKWHLGPDLQGFDISSANGTDAPNVSHYGSVTVAQELTDAAIQFIDENQDRPFFLYLSHWDAHVPHVATEDELVRWSAVRDALPRNRRRELNPAYAAMIERLDRSVGAVVDKIDELGLGENTLIVFTSDNGGVSGASELAPLRSMKGSLFEGGIRVPLCVRWPSVIESGTVCDTPVSSVDYLPTFADSGGVALTANQLCDGMSLLPLFKGGSADERSLFWHFPLYLKGPGLDVQLADGQTASWRGFPSTAMRTGKWKAVEFLEGRRVELYDLEADPGETRDRSAEFPEITEQMRRSIHAWQQRVNAPVPQVKNPQYVGQ